MKIQKTGLKTSIQDLGRQGFRKYGISTSGAMDLEAMCSLNLLLHNPDSAPVLEFTFPGPELLFEENAVFALYGGDFAAELQGTPLQNGKCYAAAPGDVLRFRKKKQGMWCYLGFQGETNLPQWLGSHASDPLLDFPAMPAEIMLKTKTAAPKIRLNELPLRNHIPVVLGAHISAPLDQVFTISPEANRMGYRLKGPVLDPYQEQISAPVQRGNVQLLPSGELIVLMADAQTSGGYPLWGYVPPVGTNLLARLGPGESFTWQVITWEEVEKQAKETENRLLQLAIACQLAWKSIVT